MKTCCTKIRFFANKRHEANKNIFDDPDVLLVYVEKFDEYGIIIHDGGSSYILIDYCPWCGKKLPMSKRDLWFDELEKLGFENPFAEEIPKEFESDAWWKAMEQHPTYHDIESN